LYGDRGQPIRERAVAELPAAIEPPAVGRAIANNAAGVILTGAQTREAQSSSHGYRGQLVREREVRIAHLAVTVQTPAVGRAPGDESAGVETAGCDRCEAEAAAHPLRREARGPRTIAWLAEVVQPPAVCVSGHRQTARMGLHRITSGQARGDGREAEPALHSDGSRGAAAPGVAQELEAPAVAGPEGRDPATMSTAGPDRHERIHFCVLCIGRAPQ